LFSCYETWSLRFETYIKTKTAWRAEQQFWRESGVIYAVNGGIHRMKMKSTFFQFIKRDLTLGIVTSALVFVSALAWGGPFLTTNQLPAAFAAAQTATLSGTVMHDGNNVYLSLGSGKLYELENVRHARSFDGKFVTVTGRVNAQAKLILVERIGS
jgi:Protein of unknown function (DUF5818)